MGKKKIRVLLGKLGEGHNQGLLSLAKRLGEAGFEVIYTDLQDPRAIVKSAMQEYADHIGITTLPGGNIKVFEEIRALLESEGAGDMTITAGGYLEEADIPRIKAMGVAEFFPLGTPFEDLVEWSKTHIGPRA